MEIGRLIETERLVIREILDEDKGALVEMASDGSWNDVGFDAKCQTWIEEWIQEARSLSKENNPRNGYLAYGVVLKETEKIIGMVGCSYYRDLDEVGIAYCLGSEYRNRGYASEAVKAYAEYVFRQYDKLRLIATIREDNRLSWRVVERVGFELIDRKLYQDVNDEKEELYRFYVFK